MVHGKETKGSRGQTISQRIPRLQPTASKHSSSTLDNFETKLWTGSPFARPLSFLPTGRKQRQAKPKIFEQALIPVGRKDESWASLPFRPEVNSLIRPQRLRNIRANQGVNLLCPEGNSQPDLCWPLLFSITFGQPSAVRNRKDPVAKGKRTRLDVTAKEKRWP